MKIKTKIMALIVIVVLILVIPACYFNRTFCSNWAYQIKQDKDEVNKDPLPPS